MKSQELRRFVATITPLNRQKKFFYTPLAVSEVVSAKEVARQF